MALKKEGERGQQMEPKMGMKKAALRVNSKGLQMEQKRGGQKEFSTRIVGTFPGFSTYRGRSHNTELTSTIWNPCLMHQPCPLQPV